MSRLADSSPTVVDANHSVPTQTCESGSGWDTDFSGPVFKRKLQGQLLFRLLLAVFFLILTLIVQIHRQEDLLSSELSPLYFFSCILFIFTIVAALSLKHAKRFRRFAFIQIAFDIAAVTVLIYFSGGVESLFSFLYMPVIISAALLLYRPGSLLAASVCSLCYGLLLDFQFFGWIAPLQIIGGVGSLRDSGIYFQSILMNIAGFYLVAYLSGYLAEELQRSSRQARKHKHEYHRLEQLHRNIVQSMSSGLLTIGQNGYVLFCNDAAQAILGLGPEDVQGQSFQKIFPSLEPTAWPLQLSSSRSSGTPSMERMETTYTRPSGKKLALGYTVSVLHTTGAEPSGWIFNFQDLTQLKTMEAHVQRMERLAFAGRIASEIAHEIKNPLAAMSGAIQMLEPELQSNPVHSRLTRIVHREIDRIDDLVTDFLWLARGSRKPECQKDVPICGVIQEVITLLKSQERVTSGHQIVVDFAGDPMVSMDPHHFRQIIWNLLKNALESMPEGGVLTIGVDVCGAKPPAPAEVRINIRDTGEGLSEEARQRMFEPFFTTKLSGTGLGLSIVYQLVQNAGGRIEVPASAGPGACFLLFFPATPFPLANAG